MDISSVGSGSYAQSAQLASSAESTPSVSAEGIIGILKDSVEIQGDMALKLIEAGLETSFTQDKMAIAQQIIDVYA